MLNRLLPRNADNNYQGHRPALWLFGVVVLSKVIMSLNSIFNGRYVATSADGIPLDTFTPAAAQTVVALFAIWALAQLIICLVCIAVLARYRAMIPMMFALLLLEHIGRKLVLQVLPIVRTGAPPGFAVNLVLLALIVVGLTLSLWNHGNPVTKE
jgi:hypothetical protein